MMDADTFDRCDGNEDAIEAAKKQHEVAQRLHKLMLASTLIATSLGNDFMDDMDWEFEDYSDEEFNC